MLNFSDLNLMKKLEAGEHVVVEAFGSSNTQRRIPGMTWFDFVELGFRLHFGKGCGTFINTGIGGDTTKMMLDRFDRDVKRYTPDLVIITAGGNDCNPNFGITPEMYYENLCELHRRITDFGGQVLLQTYYSCQFEYLLKEQAEGFVKNMQMIRVAAQNLECALHDNFARWETLRKEYNSLYNSLMVDSMHVNPDGNSVIGLDLLRSFNVEIPEQFRSSFRTGYFIQKLLDNINA